MTLVSIDHVPDEVYAAVHQQFTDEELIYPTLAIISINGWNRLAISFRAVPTWPLPVRLLTHALQDKQRRFRKKEVSR